jgi:hypothetical protein
MTDATLEFLIRAALALSLLGNVWLAIVLVWTDRQWIRALDGWSKTRTALEESAAIGEAAVNDYAEAMAENRSLRTAWAAERQARLATIEAWEADRVGRAVGGGR